MFCLYAVPNKKGPLFHYFFSILQYFASSLCHSSEAMCSSLLLCLSISTFPILSCLFLPVPSLVFHPPIGLIHEVVSSLLKVHARTPSAQHSTSRVLLQPFADTQSILHSPQFLSRLAQILTLSCVHFMLYNSPCLVIKDKIAAREDVTNLTLCPGFLCDTLPFSGDITNTFLKVLTQCLLEIHVSQTYIHFL